MKPLSEGPGGEYEGRSGDEEHVFGWCQLWEKGVREGAREKVERDCKWACLFCW